MSFLSWYSLFREQTNARRSTFLFFPSTESTLRRIYPLLRRRTHKECDEDAKNNSLGRCNARELTWNDKDNKKSIVFHEYSSWILTLEWTAEGNGYGSWCRSFRFYLSVLWRVMSSFIDLIDCVSETLGLKWFLDLILADTVKTAKTLCWSYVTTQILKSNQGKQHESLACCCCRWINVVEILVEGQP